MASASIEFSTTWLVAPHLGGSTEAEIEVKAEQPQIFRAMTIRLKDGGRLLLRVGGRQVAELDTPADSTLVVLRKVKTECLPMTNQKSA